QRIRRHRNRDRKQRQRLDRRQRRQQSAGRPRRQRHPRRRPRRRHPRRRQREQRLDQPVTSSFQGEAMMSIAEFEALEQRRLLSAGDLDLSFGGGDGIFYGPNKTGGGAVAVQSDGKVLVAFRNLIGPPN